MDVCRGNRAKTDALYAPYSAFDCEGVSLYPPKSIGAVATSPQPLVFGGWCSHFSRERFKLPFRRLGWL
jgi:hypothetical protein